MFFFKLIMIYIIVLFRKYFVIIYIMSVDIKGLIRKEIMYLIYELKIKIKNSLLFYRLEEMLLVAFMIIWVESIILYIKIY